MMSNKYAIHAAAVSNKGCVRGNNEDNLYLNGTIMPLEQMDAGLTASVWCHAPTQLYSVCDGMGGADAGELASYAAVSAMKSYPFFSGKDISQALKDFCRKANEEVFHSADGQSGERRNGCTFTCVAIHSGKATIAHIGDSRVYRLHEGTLEKLTNDHSEVQRMVDLGFITEEEAAVHPKRHAITLCLGMNPAENLVEPTQSGALPLEVGDRYLLCSDGLTDMLSHEQIAAIMKASPNSEETATALVNAALEAGGKDNVTVIVLTVTADSANVFTRLMERFKARPHRD